MDLFELMKKYCVQPEATDPTEATSLPDDLREEYEERAAIMEHDGGLSKEEAEKRASHLTRNKARRSF